MAENLFIDFDIYATPQPDAVEIQWEPLLNTQPDLRVIQGGKDD